MHTTNNPVNIESTGYKTVIVPEGLMNSIKEKLGDEYYWKHDEKSDHVYLMEKGKAHAGLPTDFSTEFADEVPHIASAWYNGETANRWDD